MLEDGLLGNLNERGRKAVPVISAKVLEMNALIEQMIEAARLEDGALMLRLQEADLRDIVSDAVEAARPLVDDKHQLVLKIPDRPVRVRVDSERVKTIVTNLISNAIKYSPAGGAVSCELVNRGGIARVTVADSGLGIAKPDLPILFTRFGRVATAQTDHLPGTGLGLYLARQLARLHGGEISVDSVAGEGSNFTLHLPVSAGMRPASQATTDFSRPREASIDK
jgi:signal transduction histidine kinase